MSKIPLRTYNREIEGMIDRGQAAQAVDHCHHILKYFPKHIDTYRLLGKAFLELQRYTEAADVLQRVLACVPDDFISQIGMGIIREDEGDLDSAIWHMERAFEIQPSNVGVQNELRRLYGRRDGVQPAKIRLTRGALVRMYSRGELYQQAIGEIRAALMEDPQRIDLEVILARMYFLSGQKVAATEVCTRLIGKLPFCFEVNRILAEILPGSARAEDAKHYLQRIHALDPYLAHLSDKVLSTAEVPETAVEVDRLEWIPDQQPASLPDWTKAIGAEWSDDTDKLPDWITEVQEESSPEQIQPVQQTPSFDPKDAAESSTPEKEDEQPIFEEEDKEEIPDWMKQAGWEPATEESAQQPSAEGLFEDSETQEEAEQAELPDWLAAMAPAETEPEPEDEDTEKSEWLESILPPEKSEDEVDEPTETEDLDETESEIEPELVSRKEEEQLPEPMVDSASTPIEEEAKEQIDFREDEGALPGEESWVSEESLAELAGAATE